MCYNQIMDTERINSLAWDEEVERNNWWTKIVGEDEIEKAKRGEAQIRLTTTKAIPQTWLEKMKGKKVLALASGGGQQVPLLSAYGANVTSLDISEKQIEQDKIALEKYSLTANTIVASMLSLPFENESFDVVFNPISLNFVEDLKRAYSEMNRVLKNSGTLMIGIANPVLYIFDEKKQDKKLKVKYTLPFSSLTSLSKKEIERKERSRDTLEFSHTLSSILGLLIDMGFVIDGFYTDSALSEPTDSFIYDCFLAIKATKQQPQ